MKFDLFLSYAISDREIVRNIADRLRDTGLRVWVDFWQIQAGDLIGKAIDDGLDSSRVLVSCISTQALKSEWAQMEIHCFRFRDPTNKNRRFIPLLLDDCELPSSIRQFANIDWRAKSETAFAQLVAACSGGRDQRSPDLIEPSPNKSIGKRSSLRGLAITSDGKLAATGAKSQSVLIWNLYEGRYSIDLQAGQDVNAVAIPKAGNIVLAAAGHWVRQWSLGTWGDRTPFKQHATTVTAIAISLDDSLVASGDEHGVIILWELLSLSVLQEGRFHAGEIRCLTFHEGSKSVMAGTASGRLIVWPVDGAENANYIVCRTSITNLLSIPDSDKLVLGCSDGTIRIWNWRRRQVSTVFEGHTAGIASLCLTSDPYQIVTGSSDQTIRVWDIRNGHCVSILKGHAGVVTGLVFIKNPDRILSASEDGTLREWSLPELPGLPQNQNESRYTNAKVLLVGETGVGKSGLCIRLAKGYFENTVSTDGVWATQLRLPQKESDVDVDREIWIWDFAGQADYRLIHQLYMDETTVAVLVFNPQTEDPFSALDQWIRALKRAAKRSFRMVLVAGRSDRGGAIVSRNLIDDFCEKHSLIGYVETSATTGAGCEALKELIVKNIPWEEIAWTASPHIFRVLKDEIIALKDEGIVLLRFTELNQQLMMRLPHEEYTSDQLRAVVGLLAGPGIVWRIDFGDLILLQPDRINAYAAAVIRTVRSHSDEIGAIDERRIINGELEFGDLSRLRRDDEKVVLRALYQLLIKQGLCLRERTHSGFVMVFPSYFKRERPLRLETPVPIVSFKFEGNLDEVYATMIVKLLHTAIFKRDNLWRYSADFYASDDAGIQHRVGLRMLKRREQNEFAVIDLYFDKLAPKKNRAEFIQYVYEHLLANAESVEPIKRYVCQECGKEQKQIDAISFRIEKGHKDILCQFCESRTSLEHIVDTEFNSKNSRTRAIQLEEVARGGIVAEDLRALISGHLFSIAQETGFLFSEYEYQVDGIDGELTYNVAGGNLPAITLLLQFVVTDCYDVRQEMAGERLHIKVEEYISRWRNSMEPIMLLRREADGIIYWMNITSYLRKHPSARTITYDGEPLGSIDLYNVISAHGAA